MCVVAATRSDTASDVDGDLRIDACTSRGESPRATSGSARRRLQDHRQPAERHLRDRRCRTRARPIVGDRFLPHVVDHADDRDFVLRIGRRDSPAENRTPMGSRPFRYRCAKRAVDDRDRRRVPADRPGRNRGPRGSSCPIAAKKPGLTNRWRVPIGCADRTARREARDAASSRRCPCSGKVRRRADADDARQRRRAARSSPAMPRTRRRRWDTSGPATSTSKISALVGGESEVRAAKLREAAHEPAGAGDEHDRQRDLGDRHHAQPARGAAPADVDRPLSFISVRTSVAASRSAGAKPTSTPLTHERDQREQQDASIERDRVEPRQLARADASAARGRRRTRRDADDRAGARRAARTRSAAGARCGRGWRRATTRTAISRARAAPRASSRFVTFTHASTSSSAVADSTMIRIGPEVADDRRHERLGRRRRAIEVAAREIRARAPAITAGHLAVRACRSSRRACQRM